MTATQHNGRHRCDRRRGTLARSLGTVSMMGVAGAAGWLVTTQIVEPAPSPAAQRAVAAPAAVPAAPAVLAHREIQRTGQVTATSAGWLTTTGADGQSTTFRVTPETARIGAPSALQSNVVVVGVVHDGVPVATAIAEQSAIGPDGAPMDFGLPA